MDRDYESESGSAESYEMKEKGVIEETMDRTVEDMIDIIAGEKKGSESASINEEEKERGRKKRIEEIKRRERSNSASILEYMTGNFAKSDGNISKRRREEWEKEMETAFKKSNRLERTPLNEKRQVEEEKEEEETGRMEEEKKKNEGTGDLIVILKEIKVEMSEMRKEMKELKTKIDFLENGWELREKGLEERMDKIEKKVKETEIQKKEEKEESKKAVEEVVIRMMETWRKKEKIAEQQEKKTAEKTKNEVKKLKRIIEDKERKDRKNNIVIRGLRNEKEEAKKVGKEFLEKEFGAGGKIKYIKTEGKEKREVIIVEMENWQTKEKIMKEKSKLRGRNIFIDHDKTKEEREVQRKLRERAGREREEGRKVKVGYRKIIVEGKVYIWNDEEEELREKENFGKAVRME